MTNMILSFIIGTIVTLVVAEFLYYYSIGKKEIKNGSWIMLKIATLFLSAILGTILVVVIYNLNMLLTRDNLIILGWIIGIMGVVILYFYLNYKLAKWKFSNKAKRRKNK